MTRLVLFCAALAFALVALGPQTARAQDRQPDARSCARECKSSLKSKAQLCLDQTGARDDPDKRADFTHCLQPHEEHLRSCLRACKARQEEE